LTYRVTLPCGVRVIGEHIPAMRSVSIGVWIATGSRDEELPNNGISHFIEHMMFKGTERHSARQLAELFDGIGGQVNAFTSKEYTCFYAKVLDEHFSIAVDTLADMLFESQFVAEEIEKEKKVVIEEIRMTEDMPDDLVMDMISELVYPQHPLGYTILGQESNLLSFSQSHIHTYMQQQYRADNMVVAIAGNVDQDVALDEIQKLFARAEMGTPTSTVVNRPTFVYQNGVKVKDIEQVHLCLAAPGLQAGGDNLYALMLLNNYLGNSTSSRLFQEIREEKGYAYTVFSFHSAYRDCGMFGIYAATSPEHVREVLDMCVEICRDVCRTGMTEQQLAQGKEQMKGSMMLSLESTSSRMSRLAKNELLLHRDVSLDETLKKINQVTIDDIQAIATEILGQRLALAAVGPVTGLALESWGG